MATCPVNVETVEARVSSGAAAGAEAPRVEAWPLRLSRGIVPRGLISNAAEPRAGGKSRQGAQTTKPDTKNRRLPLSKELACRRLDSRSRSMLIVGLDRAHKGPPFCGAPVAASMR